MLHIKTDHLTIKSWASEPEEGALNQARNLAKFPFAYHHIALMADTHLGYGMPIGGVMATEGVIVPNAVGVDIGCGMLAFQTPFTERPSIDRVKEILGAARRRIPVGFKHSDTPSEIESAPQNAEVVQREYDRARYQIGTLGGGNHFIELQMGDDGHMWVMVHSGSRNLGKQVCDHYNKVAKRLNRRWDHGVDPKWDLAYLMVDSKEGEAYIEEMQYCQRFALANRQAMANVLKDILELDQTDDINIHHNYAAEETHFGKEVWVHRKGATSAKLDEMGIIPGSQGTKSYIVRGLGNTQSFCSCSHGAGRVMGRRAARRKLSLEEEKKRMDEKGIVHSVRGARDLDEAPSAYKDINIVMDEQKDLVDIVVELSPIGTIKG